MPQTAIPLARDEVAAFCRRHHIRRLSLFGSVLRQDFRPDSAIDVLVEFEPGHVPGLEFFRLETALGEMFGRKVDPNTPEFLGPRLREIVLSEAQVQCAVP